MVRKMIARRKGFIHTLEALIAASMVLGFAVFVVPVLQEPVESGQIERERMSERLSTMDISGDISSYITNDSANLSGLSDQIASGSGSSYLYSIGTVSYATDVVVGNRQLDFVSGDNIITEMTVSTACGNVVELPETTVWDVHGPKNTMVLVAGLNFTSTIISPTILRINFVRSAELGEYHYRIKKVDIEKLLPVDTTVWVSSYLPSEMDLITFPNN
ncbi:MAG: hypothetical protein KAJ91_02605 [Candidatus Aenigmarchaeota archaeon]|nr:hypothetical protein [Candidatus Aenigmarchaeota archaeon]